MRRPANWFIWTMIISGTLLLDPVAHAAATASLGDRLAELDARRRAAESAVESLLATAAIGCKAEGEVGDVTSNVSAAR